MTQIKLKFVRADQSTDHAVTIELPRERVNYFLDFVEETEDTAYDGDTLVIKRPVIGVLDPEAVEK